MNLAITMMLVGLGSLSAERALADTYVVYPDGSGDFATIQEAVDSAGAGDEILLADGVFTGPGNRGIEFGNLDITVRSESGNRDVCVIDCEGLDRAFDIGAGIGPGAVLADLSIENGLAEGADQFARSGGGVRCAEGASPTLRGLAFRACSAEGGGGGVACYDGSPYIEDCLFEGCEASFGGGLFSFQSLPEVDSCIFDSNVASGDGGGAHVHAGQATFTQCTFFGNVALGGGALDATNGASVIVTSCTVVQNRANVGGGMLSVVESDFFVERSIIAFSSRGGALFCLTSGTATVDCCDIYGNTDGDYISCIENEEGSNGNIAADPLFCDGTTPILTIEATSPCAPENNGCGLIGAWPVACDGPTPTVETSWGQVKSQFR